MGMYTEIVLGVDLKRDTPKRVIDILKYMIDGQPKKSILVLDDHPLFDTERWKIMLQSDSHYFGGCSNSVLKEPIHQFDVWHLSVRSNLKNYDSEIDLFLNWLHPYIETSGFIGYMRYEEFNDPWLIYRNLYDDDNIYLCRIDNKDVVISLDDKWLTEHTIA